MTRPGFTEPQEHLFHALDDAIEHLHWEFDVSDYQGPSTCGMASIWGIDGRGSFVRRMDALASNDSAPQIERDRRGHLRVDIGGVEFLLRKNNRASGYRLSITDVAIPDLGANWQRMDVQERLHQLLLNRLQDEWDYLDRAMVTSRID